MSQHYPPDNSNQPWNAPQYPPDQPPQPYYPQRQPIYQQPVFPQPTPKKQRKTPREIWRQAGRGGKCGIISVCVILVLSMCICASAVAASGSHTTSTLQASLVTPTMALTATTTPTPVPTKVPTPKPTAKPTAIPTQAPVPTQPPAPPAPTSPPVRVGVNNNPWGYDFNTGNTITDPPASFCTYFNCIASFWNGHGYVDECNDLTYSKSGGLSGACSKHRGEMRVLYSH